MNKETALQILSPMSYEDAMYAHQALHAISEGDTESADVALKARSEAAKKKLLNLLDAVLAEERKKIKA